MVPVLRAGWRCSPSSLHIPPLVDAVNVPDVYRETEAQVKQFALSHDAVSKTQTQTLLVKPYPTETLCFMCLWARNLTLSEFSHSLSVS